MADPKEIHDQEQREALASEMACTLREHYLALLAAGFDHDDALELTAALLRWLVQE